jgi:multidrug efflux system membrane fusion protein
MQEKVVSQEQFEQREVDMNSKRYQYELNRAELDTAKLNLGYCYIDSPLSGESGKALIDNFNIVTANQDALVNIKQLRPIRVRFSVPEKYLAEIRKYREQNPLEVEAHIPGAVEPEKGTLSFVDNSTNLKTGAVMLEALFPNPEVRLWPGLFVEVRLLLTVTKDATLVPAEAVMEGPHGRYVWVVDTEQTVSMKPVKSDRRIGAMTMLAEGVEPGEIVVTDGQMMLRPGGKTITKAQAEQMMLKGPPAAGSAPGPANRPGAGK